MKHLTLPFLALVLVGSANCVPYSEGGLVNTGHSAQYRNEDSVGHFDWGYNEDHSSGGTFRKEKGGPGGVVGSYGLRDADGRMRIVHYIADHNGFRATISSNEPGVDTSQAPASTLMTNGHGNGPYGLEPHSTALAPVAHQSNEYAHHHHHHEEPKAYRHHEDDFYDSKPDFYDSTHYLPEPESLYSSASSSHDEPIFGQRLSYNYGNSQPVPLPEPTVPHYEPAAAVISKYEPIAAVPPYEPAPIAPFRSSAINGRYYGPVFSGALGGALMANAYEAILPIPNAAATAPLPALAPAILKSTYIPEDYDLSSAGVESLGHYGARNVAPDYSEREYGYGNRYYR